MEEVLPEGGELMGKLPAFQFYPGDWLKDPALRRCSKLAKGVWIDMICLSFECEERGVFSTSGMPWPDEDVAVAVGGDIAENLRAIDELLAKGVCSRNQAGALFCRRVVREEHKRRLCSEAGKKGGGNPDLTFKGTSKGRSKGESKGGPKQNPKASSSSSITISPSGDINPPTPLHPAEIVLNSMPPESDFDPVTEESRLVVAWNACEGVVRVRAMPSLVAREFAAKAREHPEWIAEAHEALRKFPLGFYKSIDQKMTLEKFLNSVEAINAGNYDRPKERDRGARRELDISAGATFREETFSDRPRGELWGVPSGE